MKKNGKRKKWPLLVLVLLLIMAAAVGAAYIYTHYIKNDWVITSHASVTGNQSTFYTITDRRGRLVIVDGGYTDDAEQVMQVIRAHDMHVDAWIVTHAHPDHAGAFNQIMQNKEDIKIDTIYTTPLHKDRYVETARYYDDVDTFLLFYDLTHSMDNVIYLQENDELDLIGMHMKVFHAWDEHVDALEKDMCNSSSLMFMLEGKEERMLFCGDNMENLEEYYIADHGNELKADYVECGHHGNWGLTQAFYDLVDAKAAFMDAPPWVLDDESSKLDGYLLKRYFHDKGTAIYEFATAPNTIVLK